MHHDEDQRQSRLSKHSNKSSNQPGSQGSRKPPRSILDSDLFVDKEKEREAMMQMFTAKEEAHDGHADNSHASLPQASDGDSSRNSSSMFERAQESGTGRQGSSEVDFDLTKTGKSLNAGGKQVSFAKQ